jgi:hypothetical protein
MSLARPSSSALSRKKVMCLVQVNVIEGVVENGTIRLRDGVSLAENTKVYVIATDALSESFARSWSRRLAHPDQAGDFRKQVVEIQSGT